LVTSKRPVKTLPLSVSTASGMPWRRMASTSALHTGLAVALGASRAEMQSGSGRRCRSPPTARCHRGGGPDP
jgi:hypothetical protein